MKQKRILALVLALALLLTSCSGGTAATTMKLAKTEGTVGVSDEKGQDVTLEENLGLYSGYAVETETESYAWVNLDDVKLTKLDEDTEIEITKDGKKLEIEVKSGALFFNITEPLADNETLDIRSSTMMVGIRGTCGWVSMGDPDHMTLYLLEGTVECTAGENTATVTAGEKAEMRTDGEITIKALQEAEIPIFVRMELDAALLADAREAMTAAMERHPLSWFRDGLGMGSYMNEDDLSSEMKETLLQIYNTATAGNWDDALLLLMTTQGMEEGALYETSEGSSSRRIHSELAGLRLRIYYTATFANVEIRPESGIGVYLYYAGHAFTPSGSRTLSDYFCDYASFQCSNYNQNGSFTFVRKGISGDSVRTGYVANGLLDGLNDGCIYVNGLPEGTQDTSHGWSTLYNTLTFSPESLRWDDQWPETE